MADRETVRQRVRSLIASIAAGKRSVRLSDIERVMNQLTLLGHTVTKKGDNQHFRYVVDELPVFYVCEHHRGNSYIKKGYVDVFLDRMTDLELHED